MGWTFPFPGHPMAPLTRPVQSLIYCSALFWSCFTRTLLRDLTPCGAISDTGRLFHPGRLSEALTLGGCFTREDIWSTDITGPFQHARLFFVRTPLATLCLENNAVSDTADVEWEERVRNATNSCVIDLGAQSAACQLEDVRCSFRGKAEGKQQDGFTLSCVCWRNGICGTRIYVHLGSVAPNWIVGPQRATLPHNRTDNNTTRIMDLVFCQRFCIQTLRLNLKDVFFDSVLHAQFEIVLQWRPFP